MCNVALVVMDTARFDVVSELGDDLEHLTALAAEGTRYTAARASAPWTLPSHASLFTGTYPSKHGAHAGHKRLEGDVPTLAEAFGDAGYETVGVSNNTWISEEFGFERGFGTFHRTWQYVQSDVDLGGIARTEEGLDRLTALARALFVGNPLVNLANTVYGRFLRKQYDDGARRTNEWLADWLAGRDDERPFFLFVNYLEPHLEYRPPEAFAEPYLPSGVSYEAAMDVPQDAWGYVAGSVEVTEADFELLRALYRAEIAYLDHRIGELVDLLEEHGEWDDTVFVVTGDHGENIGDHGLMDHQYCLYETLLHVPLVVHGGAFVDGGTVETPVQLTDLAPTLLDATGIDAPRFRAQAQGRSFHPGSEADSGGDAGGREPVVAEYLAPQPSMDALERRAGELPPEVRRFDRSLRSVQVGDRKLIRGSDGSVELYDLGDDPGEAADLAAEKQEIVERLETRLDAWLDSFEHATHADDVSMREETRERLEDLGYLQ